MKIGFLTRPDSVSSVNRKTDPENLTEARCRDRAYGYWFRAEKVAV